MPDNLFILEVLEKKNLEDKIAFCQDYLRTTSDPDVSFYLGDCYCRRGLESEMMKDSSFFVNNLELAIEHLNVVAKQDEELGKKAAQYITQIELKIADTPFVEKATRIKYYQQIADIHSDAWLWVACLYAEDEKWSDSAQAVQNYLKKDYSIHGYYLFPLVAEKVETLNSLLPQNDTTEEMISSGMISPINESDFYVANLLVAGRARQVGYNLLENILPFLEKSLQQVQIMADYIKNSSQEDLKKKYSKDTEHINMILASFYTQFARNSIDNMEQKSTYYKKVLGCDTNNLEATFFLGNYTFLKGHWQKSMEYHLSLYLQYRDDNSFEHKRFKHHLLDTGVVELLFSAYKLNKSSFEIKRRGSNTELLFFDTLVEHSKEGNNYNLCELILKLHEARATQLDLRKPTQRINHFGYDPYDLKHYFSGQGNNLQSAFVSLICKEIGLLVPKPKLILPPWLGRKK